MGRVSFRTRRDTSAGSDSIGVGSYARGGADWQGVAGVSTVLQDNDKSIRANDFLIAFDASQTSTFGATAVSYSTVMLSWTLTDSPLTEDDFSGSSGLIGLTVRYSNLGYPESANEGDEVYYEINPSENISSLSIFHDTVPEGRWAYYTLFGRYYQDGGGYWYEKFASVETLVPTNYGSTDSLWKRIPQYYRDLDKGDLYKFLSIFGFELDRTRTLIQSVFMGYDPLLAEAEGVDQLAKLVGLEVGVEDVGVSRTRSLLHDIGFLRRRKGTTDGIIGYLTALSGARVTFEDVLGFGYQATIHAQRANLIGNPHLFGTAGTTWDTFSDKTITKTNSSGKLVISFSGTGTAQVALISKVGIPAEAGTDYYMSSEITPTGATTYYGGGLLSSSTITILPTLTATAPINYVGTRPVWEVTTPTTTGTYYPVLYFSIPTGHSVTVDDWMLEPNNYGEYFDGSSDFGGFLYQNNFNDHLWSGTKNASYSTFTVQRKKTQEAIKRVCSSIIPVTVTFDPEDTEELRFDWVPGK
jgi:hypothetical protein